jgi:uncharacterized alpha-E superfamily protein
MMLSRVAERLYWMGRYLERAEGTARLVDAYTHLILDIPRGLEPGWQILIDTLDAAPLFQARYQNVSERNVVKFLLADRDNPSAVRHSIAAARENVRTTRDVLPAQAWELVNELHLFVADAAEQALPRKHRFEFLETVIGRNQQLNGLIHTTVTRDHALWFIKLGQLIERADMTSRIVDVATAAIGSTGDPALPEVPLLWANLLKSLSATAAYRRQVGPMLTPEEVIDFVLKRPQFPRSIVYCLDSIEETIAQLKAPGGMLRSLRVSLRPISRYAADIQAPDRLHRLIDEFQIGLGDLDDAIHEVWFARAPAG